jgi:hypothetical protein
MAYGTREEWLEAAVIRLTRLFKDINIEIPKVRVSVGWPSKGGTSAKNQVVGQCWKKSVSEDGVSQIFISPTHDDAVKVLGTLVHELIHAWDDVESGHKGEFARVARKIGLEGKLTATVVTPGTKLWRELDEISETLGSFPHAALNAQEMERLTPKQTTRMIKLHAPDCCGYTARTTRKWIDEGLPSCPHGTEMEVAE